MTECPGCGYAGTAADPEPTPPPDRHASPRCWGRYEELLARSYRLDDYRSVHQLVVDVYVAQHPGGESRTEVQRLALCLMTLCLFVEDGADVRLGAELHKRMMTPRPDYFRPLVPPPLTGLPTAADVVAASDAVEHERLVRDWGARVWRAWEPHHAVIRDWNRRALGPGPV